MNNRGFLIALVTLLVAIGIAFLPPPEGLSQKSMAMIGITVLALVYWSTECFPIPLTGIMIILLIAVLGIMPLNTALSYISSDVNILILAGLVLAIALSKHGVDRYLSLRLLQVMGERADRIALGMMLSVSLLSMWIPNTAAAAIMAPVAVGILNLIGAKKGESNLGKAIMIGVAYAASIGGIGTPVGTPPVPITIRNIKDTTNIDIGFATWMSWGVPLSLALTFFAWLLLTRLFKPEVKQIEGGRKIIETELHKVGRLEGTRLKAFILFLVAALLWTVDPIASQYVDRWTYIVSLIIIVMLISPGTGVLSWRDVSRDADWGTLFLVAGGLALGGGLRTTGLIDLFAKSLAQYFFGYRPHLVIVFISLVSSLAITVFCSITATSSTMVPVAIGIARALNLHPLIAGVASGIASCFAFLLPANTPPNAIAYSYGYFKSYEMAKAGIILILLSVLISLPFTLFLAPLITNIPLFFS
ncbi:MAG: DASS family sodium-coupled anion symporter [Desulfurococcaceae archaeon]